MARTVGIGIQNYGKIIENNCFYVDKTSFIKEWWESRDEVTLITRPRRFGKTLTMSMVEQFFSVKYAGRSDLFDGMSIWNDEYYRDLQGTYPVICLSFAVVKEKNFRTASYRIRQLLMQLYEQNRFLQESPRLSSAEKEYYDRMVSDMSEEDAPMALHKLSEFLYRHYGKKVIILLDEYDTPMQEAYLSGYWEEIVGFTRSMFNAAFKTNPWLERALMTGITRVSKESIFSDLNNLEVVTTTTDKYASSFGFTEEEVFCAMDEYGYGEKEQVKFWYDGFVFGSVSDIYNPWSILNYLDKRKFTTYWANTSSNSLVGKLIREGSRNIKQSFETLMQGECLRTAIDEQIVYDQLEQNESAIWSLLLASGYLKAAGFKAYEGKCSYDDIKEPEYELELTNLEVRLMFRNMVKGWFGVSQSDYNDFIKALLLGNIKAMNTYMNRVALATFSYFDTGKKPSEETEPERFYHGFVLGLIVDLSDRFYITSNRESGFGRYDVMLEPKNNNFDISNHDVRLNQCDAIIMEFKVRDAESEGTLQDTVQSALKQIDEMRYSASLIEKGFAPERIKKYGFAFEGKKVMIG